MANIKIIFFGLFLALCLSLPWLPASASDTTQEMLKQTQTVTLSVQQYNSLKAQFAALTLNLEQLEKNSQEDKAQIQKLKEQLKTSQDAMNKVNSSLTIAGKDWQTLNDNLQKLTEQMELLERTNKRLEQQRNIWAVVAGSVFVYGMLK